MILEDIADIDYVKTWKDLKQWINDTGTRLEMLTGTDGFDNINGKPYEEGSSGRVWKLKGKEAVLKLTTDPKEIQVAKKIAGKNLKSFIKIYKSINIKGITKNGEEIPAQIRIQELCYPISWDNLVNIGQYELIGWIQKYINQIVQGYVKETGKKIINLDFVEFFIKTVKQDPYFEYDEVILGFLEKQLILRALIFGVNLLREVTEVTGQNNLHDIDLHDSNIMQDIKGNWKMVDF